MWLFPMIGFQIATESSRISPKETQLATYHAPMGLDPQHKRDSLGGKHYLLGVQLILRAFLSVYVKGAYGSIQKA